MYRINYGNGQVSNSFSTKTAAFAELSQMLRRGDQYVEFAFVQKRIAIGEWRKTPWSHLRSAA